MKILIIVPVFNEEQNIQKCINSLLSQTIKVEQITIVNDNSKIIINFSGKKICLLIQELSLIKKIK